jgi:glycosyltransferase involved in cell wall biosynthesis
MTSNAGDTHLSPPQLPRVLHLRVVAGTGGGPEKTIINSPRAIRPHGYDAKVVYLAPPKDAVADSLRSRAAAAQCDLTILEDRGPLDFRLVAKLIRRCRRDRVKILQTHDYKSNAVGLMVRRFHRCRLVTTLHGWTDMTGRMPLYKRIDQWCLPFYESLICVSEDLHAECMRLGIPQRKVHLVHNGIDTTEYRRSQTVDEAKATIGASQVRFLIGSVARLSPEKGFDALIDVVGELQRQGLPLDLWIAGDGPERSNLQSLMQSTLVEGTWKLLGQCTPNHTRSFYEAMNLFVLNSIREGLPNVVLEAMAMSTPVVATRIAGIPTLIEDQQTGFLIEPSNRDHLRETIVRAFSAPDRCQSMIEHARERIESQFSFDLRMRRVASIYDRLIYPERLGAESLSQSQPSQRP